MLLLLQTANPRRNRYEQAREFVPPGRLMFLRPIKSAAKERKSNRKYMPVWITAQVCSVVFFACVRWQYHSIQHCCCKYGKAMLRYNYIGPLLSVWCSSVVGGYSMPLAVDPLPQAVCIAGRQRVHPFPTVDTSCTAWLAQICSGHCRS